MWTIFILLVLSVLYIMWAIGLARSWKKLSAKGKIIAILITPFGPIIVIIYVLKGKRG